jgi:4-alpha-glucanotransferase
MRDWTSASLRELTRSARAALGIDDLVLAIHDASFPSDPGEDVGRGSPYSRGARRLLAFADSLGFTGLQLGPQGVTTPKNRSPYDGTVFSRSPLSIAFHEVARDPEWEPLAGAILAALPTPAAPFERGRVHHAAAEATQARALDALFAAFEAHSTPSLRARLDAFGRGAAFWLPHDTEFEALATEAGTDDVSRWPADLTPGPRSLRQARQYALAQLGVHAQHAAMRRELHAMGWKLFGDLQIGLAPRDRWRRDALFLDDYALGAPPSRTDPLGQPWGYGILRPDSPEATAFFRARVRKIAAEYDGLRIDHPHGLVCPWVYDRREADALRAVAEGGRLFESPDLPDHPGLARYAIARADQIDRTRKRYADEWVTTLDAAQVERYAEKMAIVVGELGATGSGDIACEVLSTAPHPLLSVLRRFGLGRFRVTQKADLANTRDGYRSENAEANDWIMVGTHDTLPLARVVSGWLEAGTGPARAAYLAERLAPSAERRGAMAEALARDRGALVQAMCADLFASPARHVLVFMSDLFGLTGVYNKPGIIDEENWSLRLPNAFEAAYADNLAAGTAMDVLGGLAAGLRARQARASAAGSPGLSSPEWSGLPEELERRAQQRRFR